jgi:SAM-dependent methyltransferase
MAGSADAVAVRPQDLFAMMMGFKRTAILRTAIDLALFDALDAGPADAQNVAARVGADVRATRFLLDALAAQGLLTVQDGAYALPPGAAELLVTTSPGYCGGVTRVASSYGEWEVFGRLTETIRGGGPMPDVDAGVPDFGYWVDFAVNTTFATDKGAMLVADALDPWLAGRDAVSVLDAGCGSGAFAFELAGRHPGAQIHAQDWPAVLDVAHAKAKTRELADRLTLHPGDVFETDLGGPYDVVVASNLLFLFPPKRAAQLVERLAATLKPDGRLVIVGFMTSGEPAESEHAHLLNLLMLSWTSGGEILAPRDYEEMAAAAGLAETRLHRRPGLPLQVIVAHRG